MDVRRGIELKSLSRSLFAIGPVWLAWLFVAFMPMLLRSVPGWNPYGGWPEVPYLLTPHAGGEHVRSSVYYFVVVAIGGTVSAAVVEWSKFVCARQRTALLPYILLTAYQLVIWADAIRTNAYDWWAYLLYVVALYDIDSGSWQNLPPSLAGRWPWASAVSAAIVSIAMVVMQRVEPRFAKATQNEETNASPGDPFDT